MIRPDRRPFVVIVAATMISCAARVVAPVKVPLIEVHRIPLHGWVDLHTHPMSYLGFGGKAVAGGVDVGSILPVDPDCNAHVRALTLAQALGNDVAVHGDFTTVECGDLLRNQIVGAVEQANQAHKEPPTSHAADFSIWPSWDDIMHQKMWIDWIQRTRDSVQRVLVALAVNNRTLGDAFSGPGDGPTDDEASADLQTAQMKAFVDRHLDVMEIAYTPTDLDRIVRANKVAIILGMEVDDIGNFNRADELNDTIVASEIQRLYDQGIRYVFPIHLLDNPFGGTAVYQDLFNVSNYRENGKYWDLECAARAWQTRGATTGASWSSRGGARSATTAARIPACDVAPTSDRIEAMGVTRTDACSSGSLSTSPQTFGAVAVLATTAALRCALASARDQMVNHRAGGAGAAVVGDSTTRM